MTCNTSTVQWQNGCSCSDTIGIYQLSRAFTVASAFFILVALIYHCAAFFGKTKDLWSIVLSVLTVACGTIAVAAFSIGLPLAKQKDYESQQGSALSCPSGGSTIPGCSTFIASGVVTNYLLPNASTTWGPASGWILCAAGLGLVLIDSILICALGVPKKD